MLRTARVEGRGEPGTVLGPDGTIACGEDAVRLVEIQPAGGKRMGFQDFARGRHLAAGTRLC